MIYQFALLVLYLVQKSHDNYSYINSLILGIVNIIFWLISSSMATHAGWNTERLIACNVQIKWQIELMMIF